MTEAKTEVKTEASCDPVAAYNTLVMYALDTFMIKSISTTLFKKAIYTALAFDNKFLIKRTGPFVYSARDEIAKGNILWFAKHNYEKQMKDWAAFMPYDGINIAIGVRNAVRESIAEQYKKKPDVICELANDVLANYCAVVQMERDLARADRTSTPKTTT